jgi:transposase-like protein
MRRFEVMDSGRRRRWTDAEKLKIVHERLSRLRLASRQRDSMGYRDSYC